MAFLRRLVDQLLNQALVEALANSKWFQRLAVRADRAMKEAAEKSKGSSEHLDKTIGNLNDVFGKLKEQRQGLWQKFEAEYKKLQEHEQQQRHKKS